MTINLENNLYNLAQGQSIAMQLVPFSASPKCFWAPNFEAEPVRMGDWVGSVNQGAPVNFYNVRLNPHGNGTHTECVGHISHEPYRIYECLKTYIHQALLISITPETLPNGDKIITRKLLEASCQALTTQHLKALIVRTLPNTETKQHLDYSGSNPCYFEPAACQWLAQINVEHLLVDLPSVDREEDAGALAAHKAYWQYPSSDVRVHCTITELIYVPDFIADGHYALSLQIAPFGLDAAPSNPVLYPPV